MIYASKTKVLKTEYKTTLGVKGKIGMKKIFLIAVMIVILSNGALAYIDPSTGGVIISSIWPLIVALFAAVGAFFVKWFWRPIKNIFRNSRGQ